MKKLKFKTFIILLVILTLFIISLLVIFNYQLYQRELNDVKKDLKEIETIHNNYYIVNDDVIIDGNNMKPMFINANVYVISFDSIHNITNITSYTDNGLSNAEIIKLAIDFLNTNKKYVIILTFLSNKNTSSFSIHGKIVFKYIIAINPQKKQYSKQVLPLILKIILE